MVSGVDQVRAQSRVHGLAPVHVLDPDRVLALGQDQDRDPSRPRARGQDHDQDLEVVRQDSPDNRIADVRDRCQRVEAGAEVEAGARAGAGAGAEADRQTVVGAADAAGAEVTAQTDEAEDAWIEPLNNKAIQIISIIRLLPLGTCDQLGWKLTKDKTFDLTAFFFPSVNISNTR